MKNKIINQALKNLAPIKKISVSEWADTYRMLPSTAAEPGKFKTSRTPYIKEICDSFTQAGVHKVIAMTSAQLGKTEVLLNIIGRFAHLDPCNIMMIQPTLEMAEDISKDRISKMIADTKILSEIFQSKDKTQTILSKNFRGGRLVLAGANSPAGLASRPIRILLCDEVDRFPISAASEGDPVDLASKRCSSYWNYCIGLFSTPTIKNYSRIETAFLEGTQEFWSYKCGNCGEYHELNFRNFFSVGEEIKFRCPDCGFEFSEQEIKNAPQKYIAKNPDALKKGCRSFWVNAFSSPWLSWEKIFQEWQEAKGNAALEKVVYNTRFAESYEFQENLEKESEYLKSREYYPAELPPKVLLLTAAVDVQYNRLEYEVVGWARDETSYGILRGVIPGSPSQPETWLELDKILDREFYFANGMALKIARTFIDSGFSTKNVYAYCATREVKGRFAIKGKGSPGMPLLYQYSYPRGYGITLTILGVNDGKQEVFSRLGSGAMHFPHDDNFFSRRGYDEIYFRQLLSEKKVLKRSGGVAYLTYEPIQKKIRNESLDLAVYNYAAMQSLDINFDELEIALTGAEIKVEKPVKRRKAQTRTVELF